MKNLSMVGINPNAFPAITEITSPAVDVDLSGNTTAATQVVVLTANDQVEVTIPGGAKYVKFTSNEDFYANFQRTGLIDVDVLRPEDLVNKNDLSAVVTKVNTLSLLNPEFKAIGDHDSIKLKAGIKTDRMHGTFGTPPSDVALNRRYEIKKVGTTQRIYVGTCSINTDSDNNVLATQPDCIEQGTCTFLDGVTPSIVNTAAECNAIPDLENGGIYQTIWDAATWTDTGSIPSSLEVWYAMSSDFELGVCDANTYNSVDWNGNIPNNRVNCVATGICEIDGNIAVDADGVSLYVNQGTCEAAAVGGIWTNGTWLGNERDPRIGDRFFMDGEIPAVNPDAAAVGEIYELESEPAHVTLEFFS